ncbi:CCA tRNA nucleotidyltransferase [Trichocoleus sp. FACHB-591]|uniref:CCA tRNA nucleotidyltransferase n=1 Tax=Trichocoleus sp. FACHB-591 TaxID=2692872 RepID=UPI00168883E8|nr:CCA tRNA nucleotidyltransferase [Trichocoleus sp. FACHB-591]MBD2097500.1 CCA tRNA nucleotidyltransferase [Trichocoleus sp. FACHB-591]
MYATSSISLSVLSPQTWPFGLQWLPQPAYLVGGVVRDALLGRHADYLDLDFVMPEKAVETAQAIAHHHKAGFVLLDAERQIARVVFEQATADFAQQMGSSLEIDLQRRDFTVNAIAYNPHTEELIDPLEGFVDLKQSSIRMVASENLREDPLRLLRAYRQAAQLGFSLDAETRAVIRQFSPYLSQVAAERIQSELNYLFGSVQGTPWLTAAWQDGLLQAWLPQATAQSLAQIAAIDRSAISLVAACPSFKAELYASLRHTTKASRKGTKNSSSATGNKSANSNSGVESGAAKAKLAGDHRTWITVAKLASLLSLDLAQAEVELLNLKYSRAEIQAALTIIKFLPQLQAVSVTDGLSCREQYFLFQSVGPVFPALMVRALAVGVPISVLLGLIERFLTPDDPVAHPMPLVSGQDLMTHLKLAAGPQIGQLLAEIQLARAEGLITTPANALELAAKMTKL